MTTDLQPKKSWTERKIGRRSFLVKGAAATGIAVAAMYVAPSLVSSGPKPAYAITGPGSCTPGFWKNHWDGQEPQGLDKEWPSGYNTDDPFTTHFPAVIVDDAATGWLALNATLLEVLKAHGGCENALGRHAVSAMLNAASVTGFAYTVDQVRTLTTNALATSNQDDGCTSAITTQKDAFDVANNGACQGGAGIADNWDE